MPGAKNGVYTFAQCRRERNSVFTAKPRMRAMVFKTSDQRTTREEIDFFKKLKEGKQLDWIRWQRRICGQDG